MNISQQLRINAPATAVESAGVSPVQWDSTAIPSASGTRVERAASAAPARGDGAPVLPGHIAVIMDGNGRWATRRGLPRAAGHRAGARAVDRVVAAVRRRGIRVLTLYAFSSDNWRRPASEVQALMRLLERALAAQSRRCLAAGIRLLVIGRRDRLPARLAAAIADAEILTRSGDAMELRLAVDYSGRDAILRAAAALAVTGDFTRPSLLEALGRVGCGGTPEVDLLIRTGGEQRLSDFLLWESAYAEMRFVDRLWPDMGEADLDTALSWFAQRQRRFGGVGPEAAERRS